MGWEARIYYDYMMFQLRVLARERKEDIIAIHCDTSEDHQDHGE